MILDTLSNSSRIENLHPLFKRAFEYIKSTDFSSMEDGKIILEEHNLTVTITGIFGKTKEEASIETHKKYIDIQFPLLGVEKIGWKGGSELNEVSIPYNEEKDITFYVDKPTAYTKIYSG